ncbi:hypothetical protein ACFVZH_25880 [Streptomyces sp. NPDC059534]|uniref:hypothetical protein n=1 Tax=Streptomyces sp. NPDC059534 TaxID=3346859 RepID=UPI00368BD640
MPSTTHKTTTTPPPFLEIRCRGVRLVMHHVPYRLITLVSTAAGVAAGGIWLQK